MLKAILGPRLMLRPQLVEGRLAAFSPAAEEAGDTLAAVVRNFADGYNQVLQPSFEILDTSAILPAYRGFAAEGAAMSSVLLDLLTMSRGRRFRDLLNTAGPDYAHLLHVGAGWAFAQLRLRPWTGIRSAQPMIGWLGWDGWGFHQAFFDPDRVFIQRGIERAARGDVRPVRDQGAGRALWFYAGAEPARIAAVIGGFPAGRQGDLWAGIGLAAAYTGARSAPALEELVGLAGDYRDEAGQGAAFAAKAHVLSGAVPPPAAAAIEVLTGVTPEVASAWTDAALAAIGAPDSLPAYQEWRARVRAARTRQRSGVRQ
jgi:enediyne biosynthesis protein E3